MSETQPAMTIPKTYFEITNYGSYEQKFLLSLLVSEEFETEPLYKESERIYYRLSEYAESAISITLSIVTGVLSSAVYDLMKKKLRKVAKSIATQHEFKETIRITLFLKNKSFRVTINRKKEIRSKETAHTTDPSWKRPKGHF